MDLDLDDLVCKPLDANADANAMPDKALLCPLVLNQATLEFADYRVRGEPATPERGIDDWNGYLCFMVQSTVPGESALTATTDDGTKVGGAAVRFV